MKEDYDSHLYTSSVTICDSFVRSPTHIEMKLDTCPILSFSTSWKNYLIKMKLVLDSFGKMLSACLA
jgi:hypothetical protein